MENRHKPYGPYEKYFKRPLDILCALAAIVVFGWLYIIVAILVRVKLGSPILFTQERPGKEEKIFKLYKFRTMTDARDAEGKLLPDEVRLTKFGRMLRATSLDELPEAFNILKGDMSVIGPRPLLVRYLPRYNAQQRRRHEVRPGLSGLAQVNGRNAVSWEEKFAYDVQYVDRITFAGDVKIIIDTVKKAFIKQEGISSETSATMEEFMGTPIEKMKELAIIGASGHGKVVADIARKNGYERVVFLDDNENLKECGGYAVVGKSDRYAEFNCDVIVAIGNAKVRQRILEKLKADGARIPTLIHPNAVIAENVTIGAGTVIMAGAVVNPCSKIGEGCIINTCASIDHDCQIADYVHVSVGAHLAGTVNIGERTWIGIGAVVSNNLEITGDCMIGAGAVVVKNIMEAGTYVGVPARKIKHENTDTNQ